MTLFDPQLSNFSFKNTIHQNGTIVLYVALPPKEISKNISFELKPNSVTVTSKTNGTILKESLSLLVEENDEWEKKQGVFALELKVTGLDERLRDLLERQMGFYLFSRELSRNEVTDESVWSDTKFKEIQEELSAKYPRQVTKDLDEFYRLIESQTKENSEKVRAEAFAKLTSAADKGDLGARELIASIYSSEQQSTYYNVPMDSEKAILYRRLAAFDNKDSICLFLYGISSLNESEAELALILSARAGFPPAMHRLGTFYEGKGDFAKALMWYQCGFTRGHSMSAFALHLLHKSGNGVNKSVEFAKEYLQFAVDWDPLLAHTFSAGGSVDGNILDEDLLDSTLDELTPKHILDPTNFTPVTTKSTKSVFDDIEAAIELERSPQSVILPEKVSPVSSSPVTVSPVKQPTPTTVQTISKVKPVVNRSKNKKPVVVEEFYDDDDDEDGVEIDDDDDVEEETEVEAVVSEKGVGWKILESAMTYALPSVVALFVYKRFTD